MKIKESKRNILRRTLPFYMAAAICVPGGAVHAETSFFDEVPAGDWSYAAVNQLIASGHVARHATVIPTGRVLSRFEMAVLVQAAQENQLGEQERALLSRLRQGYASDLEKVQMLSRVDQWSTTSEKDKAYSGTPVRPEVEQKAASLSEYPSSAKKPSAQVAVPPKKPVLDDKFSFWGFARIRFENYDSGQGMHRRYNHFNVHVVNQYKVNDRWQIVLGNEFQRSMDTINDMEPRHADADLNMQTNIGTELVLEGHLPGVNLSIGRMYDIGTYGFGIDSRVVGIQAQFPGKIRTTVFHGRVVDWPREGWFDHNVPIEGAAKYIEERQEYTALKFETHPDAKRSVSWGLYGISPSSRHFQLDDRRRILHAYVGYEQQFNRKWNGAVVISGNNAHEDRNLIHMERTYWGKSSPAHTSKSPVYYARLTYGKADIMNPGSWAGWLMYLKQPTLAQFSDTMGFENMEGIRPGFNYVVDKGMLMEVYATFARDIDTHERRRDIRYQLNMFF